jgi:predicted DNA-binding transcriptional regulator AlpA
MEKLMEVRLLRHNQAYKYLGMSEAYFNEKVRPYLTEIKQGRAVWFDRLDLDAWVEQFKQANGRPGRQQEERTWPKQPQVSVKRETSGTLIKPSPAGSFAKALEKRKLKQRKGN